MDLPVVSRPSICAFGDLFEEVVVVSDQSLAVNSQVRGQFVSRVGGAAGDVAMAARRQGVATSFIGFVGSDDRSVELINGLASLDVDVTSLGKGKHATVLALQTPSGETSLIVDTGDRSSVDASLLTKEMFSNFGVVHLPCFNLFDPMTRDAFLKVCKLATDCKVHISLDVSVTNELLDFGPSAFRQQLRPTLVFCNEQEGDVLSPSNDCPDGVSYLVRHRGSVAARIVSSTGQSMEVSVPVRHENFDSVGAGDWFAGGFLAAWCQGTTAEEATATGHRTAVGRLDSALSTASFSA